MITFNTTLVAIQVVQPIIIYPNLHQVSTDCNSKRGMF